QLWRPSVVGLLAEAYGRAGQAEAGLTVLDEALGLVQRTGERHGEADLYRLKGELLLALPAAHQAEAEACFRQAIAIARSQGAKSWELRAVLSLSRLYHQQGRTEDARPMLAEIYGWFREGFDTADLQEAKALLEAISCGGAHPRGSSGRVGAHQRGPSARMDAADAVSATVRRTWGLIPDPSDGGVCRTHRLVLPELRHIRSGSQAPTRAKPGLAERRRFLGNRLEPSVTLRK